MKVGDKDKDRHPEILVPEAEVRRKTRRDFLIAGVAAAAGIGGYEWVTRATQEDEAPWPQRRVLEFNGKLAKSYISNSHLMPTYRPDQVTFLKPNGDIGLKTPLNAADWNLRVITGDAASGFTLQLSDIQALPKCDLTTRFCCIEGWSSIVWWGGARFSDFARKFLPPGRALPKYVYLATPGEDYYVGLDMKSALHPQTVLAYERNGKPLDATHGAPLRLAISIKYGIKSIKRIGMIRFTDTKPADYWAEEGYDWFAGL
jgi:DMSO/TMAO reductase YedYZ molybdopterin-dependent catalytic subunit